MTSPTQLEQWLSLHQWQAETDEPNRFREWVSPDGEQAVLVPHDDSARDFSRLLNLAIAELARGRDLPMQELVTEIETTAFDRVLVHGSPLRRSNKFDLDAVINLMSATRAGLKDAASSVVEARLRYGTRRATVVKNYVDELAVGYSFPGSYAFPIFTPLNLVAESGQESIASETFERRSTIQFSRALRTLIATTAEVLESDDISAFDTTYTSGVSSNLCSAAADMFKDKYFDSVRVSLELSAAIPARQEPDVVVPARVEPVLREAAERLKSLTGKPVGASLTGEVAELSRDYERDGGKIVVRTLLDGKQRNVNLVLPPESYKEAINAHDQKRSVFARGILELRGNRRWLVEVERFSLVASLDLPGED